MQEHGLSLPLPPQGTTNADDRFEKGLDKQVQLFGEGMRKQQSEAPQPRRNINRWLAANCFGDYYTRNGLNDAQRELEASDPRARRLRESAARAYRRQLGRGQ